MYLFSKSINGIHFPDLIVIILLLNLFPVGYGFLQSQNLPLPPKNPREPIFQEERDQRGDKPKDLIPNSQPNPIIRVTLCDGRVVTGKWEISEIPTELTFHHNTEGIKYSKTIPLSNLASVYINNWKPNFQKKEKDGDSYKLLPHSVTIRTKIGEIFNKQDGLDGTQFSIITLENSNGRTILYSLWIDLLYKDGSWFTKLKPIQPNENREECFKDVWKSLEFI